MITAVVERDRRGAVEIDRGVDHDPVVAGLAQLPLEKSASEQLLPQFSQSRSSSTSPLQLAGGVEELVAPAELRVARQREVDAAP